MSKKKKNVAVREEYKPDPPKPVMDTDVLHTFLCTQMVPKASDEIRVNAEFMWERFNCERHRVNVWSSVQEPGAFCKTHTIIASFFLHYDRATETIEDMTIHEKLTKI
jgi:hypothetical protein